MNELKLSKIYRAYRCGFQAFCSHASYILGDRSNAAELKKMEDAIRIQKNLIVCH